MDGPDEHSWSDNPNAPMISHHVYLAEKEYLAGFLIGSILYGTRKNPYLYAHIPVPTLLVRFTRDAHRAVLQMYGRPAQTS